MKRTPLKKTPLKKSNYRLKKTRTKKSWSSSMNDFFLELWDKSPKPIRCYETGAIISEYYRTNSSIYHHILHKSEFPEFALDERNICFLLPDVHNQVHTNIDFTPKVKELTRRIRKELLNFD